MAEYIEREAALALVRPDGPNDEKAGVTIATVKKLVRHILTRVPAVDVAPVVHARWEPCFDENCRCRWGFGKCSNCGQEYYAHAINHYKYCPICGAKMDGKVNDGKIL